MICKLHRNTKTHKVPKLPKQEVPKQEIPMQVRLSTLEHVLEHLQPFEIFKCSIDSVCF